MTASNREIADILDRVGTLLELDEANPFRVRAYHRAARTLRDLPDNVTELLRQGTDLSELPGIGKDLAGKIAEIAETGHFALLDELERRLPEGLVHVLGIGGLGPKRVHKLYETLGINSPEALAKALREGRLHGLPHFGEKTLANIRRDLAARRHTKPERFSLADAEARLAPLLEYLRAGRGVISVEAAGSYRRRCDTVGDLDVLACCEPSSDIVARFLAYPEVERIVSRGAKRSTTILRGGLQVDLRIVPAASHGAALVYLTGSKNHNIAIRRRSLERGLKINEYGVFRNRRRIASQTEEEVYGALGLPWIAPELREDRGEIAAALEGRLPRLVTRADLRGDLHCHTTATDGRNSLAEMAAAAQRLGYEYLAVTDHSHRVSVAHGLDPERLARQLEEIDRLNETLSGLTLLKGCEVDILEDGSLDLPASILRRLDFTVCSVHYGLRLGAERQTGRIIRAMDDRHFSILGHPTGRLLGQRPPYAIDLPRLFEAAHERGCHVEANAQPDRLDLAGEGCRLARELGVMVAVSTDAHSIAQLDLIRFAVDQARRGWLGPGEVLNARPLEDLRRLLKRR